MRIKYVGPHDEVEVPALNLVVANGQVVEVKTADAESLLEQPSNWQRVEPKAAKEADK
jgi:hypothetical protein